VWARTSRRLDFHAGDEELAAGLSVHLIGGHTDGLQVVRVETARGARLLGSDLTHLYEKHRDRPALPHRVRRGAMLEGYDTLRRLASTPDAIVPGHDPLVRARYPLAGLGLDGIAVRLDG
jgi:glyoxylase-like metal-dependent hydrolase (beta-lactamase superfamily II)